MPTPSDFVANCSMLYADTPTLRRPAAATADGYRKLEFWWPFEVSVPDAAAVDEFVDAVAESRARVVAMNFTLGDTESGGRGIVSHPDRAAEFGEHLGVVADIVTRLGIQRCNVPFGIHLPQYTAEQQLDTAVANLSKATDRLHSLGAVPMLEPLSGVDNYPVVTAAQAVRIIAKVDDAVGRRGTVGLLADLYHFAANGEDIDAVLHDHWERIVHVQVADFPGRHEPGTGQLEIDRYLGLLRDLGYRGEVALEYIPSQ
ncbi:TIM barrel protein [Mycobacterium sp. 21AC1]|uniref:TIM barrel protein n=1 Tax=[Mycobacterium] appelbergii TaxID=2939269 RepID=UPI002938D388|nr:TIM barrel protein [Mycobacterium sp. 21AC1]MDV3130194.1 TIM barrel protein [Mycobacterium sp. 21AC1]